eukprot:452132_1
MAKQKPASRMRSTKSNKQKVPKVKHGDSSSVAPSWTVDIICQRLEHVSTQFGLKHASDFRSKKVDGRFILKTDVEAICEKFKIKSLAWKRVGPVLREIKEDILLGKSPNGVKENESVSSNRNTKPSAKSSKNVKSSKSAVTVNKPPEKSNRSSRKRTIRRKSANVNSSKWEFSEPAKGDSSSRVKTSKSLKSTKGPSKPTKNAISRKLKPARKPENKNSSEFEWSEEPGLGDSPQNSNASSKFSFASSSSQHKLLENTSAVAKQSKPAKKPTGRPSLSSKTRQRLEKIQKNLPKIQSKSGDSVSKRVLKRKAGGEFQSGKGAHKKQKISAIPAQSSSSSSSVARGSTVPKKALPKKKPSKPKSRGSKSKTFEMSESELDESESSDDEEPVVSYLDPADDIDDDFRFFHGAPARTFVAKTLADLNLMTKKEVLQREQVLGEKHKVEKRNLTKQYESEFEKWYLDLKSDFNLLFYGVGSKKLLLQKFVRKFCTDGPLYIVNGYFPAVSIRDILKEISREIIPRYDPFAPKNMYAPGVDAHAALIARYFDSEQAVHPLYILINNIDGKPLRTTQAQIALSLLANSKRIHMIASYDHVRSPLLWDGRMLDQFSWCQRCVHTFRPYSMEGSCVEEVVAGSLESRTTGIEYILRSLTPNHREILKVLAEEQLTNGLSEGIPFPKFLELCLDIMLINSDVAFRAHLKEMTDHGLIEVRRGRDGAKMHVIPYPETAIRKHILTDDV